MKKLLRVALTIVAVVAIRDTAKAQWLTGIGGRQYLTNPTTGVRIGTTNLLPPSALTVLGAEMSNPTGEVFRTDAPNANSTYWRMFRGGTQYGLLYNLTGSTEFNMKALNTTGNLWLRNSLDNGIRLNSGTSLATIGIFKPQQGLMRNEWTLRYCTDMPGPEDRDLA